MEAETRSVLRWTLASGGAWGGLFGGVAALRASSAGVALGEVAAPLLALALLGFTVGGLTGPLARSIWLRRRGEGS